MAFGAADGAVDHFVHPVRQDGGNAMFYFYGGDFVNNTKPCRDQIYDLVVQRINPRAVRG